MDVLELKRQYESLGDDELMRVWADEEGLTDIARSVLSDEVTRRGLASDPRSQARKGELKQELLQNQQRYQRHQKRVVWKLIIYGACAAISVIAALIKLFSK